MPSSTRLPNAIASPNAQSIAAAGERLAALLHEALQLRMQMEVCRNRSEPVDDPLGQFAADAGGSCRRRRRSRRRFLQLVSFRVLLRGVVPLGKPREVCLLALIDIRCGQHLFAHQALRILREHGRLLLDLLIHQRLRISGIVAFVMPVAPIADDVDDNVLLELLPEVVRHLRDANDRFGIVAVHVPDRACTARAMSVA